MPLDLPPLTELHQPYSLQLVALWPASKLDTGEKSQGWWLNSRSLTVDGIGFLCRELNNQINVSAASARIGTVP